MSTRIQNKTYLLLLFFVNHLFGDYDNNMYTLIFYIFLYIYFLNDLRIDYKEEYLKPKKKTVIFISIYFAFALITELIALIINTQESFNTLIRYAKISLSGVILIPIIMILATHEYLSYDKTRKNK